MAVTLRGRKAPIGTQDWKRDTVVLLGFGLLIIGIIIGMPLVWTLGIILLAAGYVLAVRGRAGHKFVGRSHWF